MRRFAPRANGRTGGRFRLAMELGLDATAKFFAAKQKIRFIFLIFGLPRQRA
jgi:hypothetical protein